MNIPVKDKLTYLKELLSEMSTYHSAQSVFARKFGKVYGSELNRNFVSRVLKGEITFVKELYYYIDDAIVVAQGVIQAFKSKAKKQHNFVPLKSIIDEKASMIFLEEQISLTDNLYEKGYMVDASKLIYSLDSIIDTKNVLKFSPFIFAIYHLAYSKVQMQFGVTTGAKNSMYLVNQGINVFQRLNEPEKLIKSYSLQGHIYRQLEEYDTALSVFENNKKFVLASKINEKDKNQFLVNIDHQIALTLMNKAYKHKQENLFGIAEKIFVETNQKLRNSDNEIFSKLSEIREAELYVKNNNITSADNILGNFEDYTEIGVLQPPQRAIFFRVNTEKYAKILDVKNCLKNFKAAVSISNSEGYKHELKQLNELYIKYEIIRNNLIEQFSVYKPIW